MPWSSASAESLKALVCCKSDLAISKSSQRMEWTVAVQRGMAPARLERNSGQYQIPACRRNDKDRTIRCGPVLQRCAVRDQGIGKIIFEQRMPVSFDNSCWLLSQVPRIKPGRNFAYAASLNRFGHGGSHVFVGNKDFRQLVQIDGRFSAH
jgi:hypothetical protein